MKPENKIIAVATTCSIFSIYLAVISTQITDITLRIYTLILATCFLVAGITLLINWMTFHSVKRGLLSPTSQTS